MLDGLENQGPMPIANHHPPQNSDSSSGETVLERMIKRIGRTNEFPAISKYLIEINRKLTSNPETSNASELANVILKDYALTNKMLKLVNSAFYGLAAGKVTTVTRAVVVLGYENVRLAALSLVLFEHIKGKSNTADMKDTLVSSFWQGLMARDIAQLDGRIDPEEAFICAMMSQLGKLLMIRFLPDEYRGICQRMTNHGESEAQAAKKSCGVTYEALGQAVAEQWNFPSQLTDSMQILKDDDLQNKKRPPDGLGAVCSFTKELAAVVQKKRTTDKRRSIHQLLKRYESCVDLSKDQLKILVKASSEKIKKHTRALNFKVGKSRFIDALATAYQTPKSVPEKRPSDGSPSTAGYQLGDGQDPNSPLTVLATPNSKDIIMEGIQEISEAMLAENDINDVVVMSLEIFYRSLGFQRAIMFIRENSGNKMRARFGYGDDSKGLIQRVEFSINGSQDLFKLSMQVGKDLIVADTSDPKINHLIPQWYRRLIDAPAFMLLPVRLQNVCIAALYADRDANGQPITKTEHRHLSMLRNQLILAFKYQRAGR
jgi:HD-like signal output (HDOD) protein